MAKETIPKKPAPRKAVKTLTHDEATRKNIPTAEYQSVLAKNEPHKRQTGQAERIPHRPGRKPKFTQTNCGSKSRLRRS